jgi:hypothetical protein
MAYKSNPAKGKPSETFFFRKGATHEETRALQLTDAEFEAFRANEEALSIGERGLGNQVLTVGMDWEHMLSTLPFDLSTADPVLLAAFERLGKATLTLSDQIRVKFNQPIDPGFGG